MLVLCMFCLRRSQCSCLCGSQCCCLRLLEDEGIQWLHYMQSVCVRVCVCLCVCVLCNFCGLFDTNYGPMLWVMAMVPCCVWWCCNPWTGLFWVAWKNWGYGAVLGLHTAMCGSTQSLSELHGHLGSGEGAFVPLLNVHPSHLLNICTHPPACSVKYAHRWGFAWHILEGSLPKHSNIFHLPLNLIQKIQPWLSDIYFIFSFTGQRMVPQLCLQSAFQMFPTCCWRIWMLLNKVDMLCIGLWLVVGHSPSV